MSDPARSIFQIEPFRSIWRVKLDGAFFGDYRTKKQAIESVGEARVALDATGRIVKVVVETSEHGIAH